MNAVPVFPVVVAANFTAEPIRAVLAHWLGLLAVDAPLAFAPYDQVLQQLLDPAGLTSVNTSGVNVLLVRPYGCERAATEIGRQANERGRLALLAADELVRAIDTRARAGGGLWILACRPPPPGLGDERWDAVERRSVDGLARTPGVYVVRGTDVLARYAVREYHDEHGQYVADIPYTRKFFTALGTAIARAVHVMITPPRKVIVLDCDHTLWTGICGEDRAAGVTIDEPRRCLHRFLIQRMHEGLLLCLCSKNEEADVWRVFHQRDDMELRREHIVASRINWRRKSENIRALSEELGLALETFIFLDDDPVECAEVRAQLPDVLTMQLPARSDVIPAWLDRQWVFDRWRVTAEDRGRTRQYRLDQQRECARATAPTVHDFVRALKVRVAIRPATASELPRIAQLTHRTTQFNCTLRGWSESGLHRAYGRDDTVILAVSASDRYGDYGLVGAVIARAEARTFVVEAFLLSCRTLGRNVEQRMLAELVASARRRGCDAVRMPFVAGPRNAPARAFLDGLQPQWSRTTDAVGVACTCFAYPLPGPRWPPRFPHTQARRQKGHDVNVSDRYRQLAEAQALEQIWQAATPARRRADRSVAAEYCPPANDVESTLVDIWRDILGMDCVGVDDNFFELGGDSLQMAQVLTAIHHVLAREVALETFFDGPTIRRLADAIARAAATGSRADALARTLAMVEHAAGSARAGGGPS